MLNSILTEITPWVTAEERTAAAGALGRYAARLTRSREFNRLIKRLPPAAHQRLRESKQRVLDRSDYFLTRLWRAVYEHVRYGLKVEVVADQFEVRPDDISLVLRSLSGRDRLVILRSRMQVERLADEQRQQLVKEIRRHAHRLVRRLRFIAKYDPAISLQDLENGLVEEGYSALQQYEHFGPRRLGKILNFVRSSMSNRSINAINFHTSRSRAAVSSDLVYRCPQCEHEFRLRPGIRGQCPKCHAAGEPRQTEREFVVARVSLDDCLRENTAHLADFEVRTAVAPEAEVSRDQLLEKLRQVPDRRVRRFFKLIDQRRNAFRRWLGYTHGRFDANRLSLPELGRYAREYLGISVDELVKGLKGVIDDDVLAWHQQRCCSCAS